MTASDVMDRNPTVLHDTDTIDTAVKCIMDNRYRNLAIVDAEGRYLGVFTVNCLIRTFLPKAVVIEHGLESAPFIDESLPDLKRRLERVKGNSVMECMTDEATVVRPDTPILETVLILYKTRTSIPVVDKETRRLVGMISYFDISRKVLESEL